ncbi:MULTISPECIES: DNA cytosine methyltransferase [Streptomycetaceae]|uniref:DNA cytosine methyltransferase n=1 Tax=Streptomycetaceae TaxID=2062 RepID=UPI001F51B5E0|nr:DNA cytosine methyltransferase [Streptomyces sp. CB02056]
MAFLMPQLLPAAVDGLCVELKDRTVEELRTRAAVSHPAMYYAATGGRRLPADRLAALREAVVAVAAENGFPAQSDRPPARRAAARFDTEVARLLYKDAGIIPAEALSPQLWAFLSLVVMPDVAAWRFPGFNPRRVTGRDITRHVFGRLWWRAHLVGGERLDPDDLYDALSVLGEEAFDQVFARRTSIGASSHLVCGILRVWQEFDIPDEEVADRQVFRDFLKRILRLRAFVSFDALDEKELDEELRTLVQESLATVTGRDMGREPEPPVPIPAQRPSLDAVRAIEGPDTGGAGPTGSAVGGTVAEDAPLTVIDLCAGAGGMALGLERAGFEIAAAVEIDADSCDTLRTNRPGWQVLTGDLQHLGPEHSVFRGNVDVMVCGLPRSPYTSAGRQQATSDPRDVLVGALAVAVAVRPRILVLENIPDFVEKPKFEEARAKVLAAAEELGYVVEKGELQAVDFGVPQLRGHGFAVAMSANDMARFTWPAPLPGHRPTLGETLLPSMAAGGWPHAAEWAAGANVPAPLIVGGATGRGGADLGPSRSKAMWARLGVYGGSLGDEPPAADFVLDREAPPRGGLLRLTLEQVALLQGLPASWKVQGGKTSVYRQISQAVPPVVAEALGRSLLAVLGPRA